MKYVPLHLHSEYSLLDGAIRLKDLCKFAKENDMPAVAVTDHGVMYGAIDFYRTAKEIGVKPLIGCEFYVYDGELSEKNSAKTHLNHLVLIAKDKQGYANLVKLVSISHCEGFYYKPRVNFDLIKQYSQGLVCLSACVHGEIADLILQKELKKAQETAKKYKELFKDDYYIELQDHGLDSQKRSNPDLINIAKELDIKLVITNDSHYLKKEDADWHDTLLCLQTNALKTDENRFHFPNNEFYLKTVSELRDAFKWLDAEIFEQAIGNTVEIAEKCHLIIEMGKNLMPDYEVPKGHTVESYLELKVREGLKKKYKEIIPEIEERVKYELRVIEQMGFAAYFLITWDFINFAKENGIPVGPGRGSAAGSIVAYALNITELDPIRHNLLFERFLNPERISMPDVDIDFCIERRSEVIDYVAKKYGADKVCQIVTFGTFAAKAALKGVARVFNIPFAESNKLSSLIPSYPGARIDDALLKGMELKQLYDSNSEMKKLVDMAKSIEGIKNNIGMHAAGVIISKKPLNEIVPVQPSKEGIIITEYPMADLEKLGLLKMDFLGLRNLTIIDKTLKMVKKRHEIDIDINQIPLDDKKTYKMLTKGETSGVFQLESSGMRKLVRELKHSVFEDLGALVALFRPGPLESGMVEDFVERKHGRQTITYAHPSLEPILKDTYGTIVYQEQIMQIFQTLAGYSLGQADMVRRMMGKKKLKEMAKQKDLFIEGAWKNGMKSQAAAELFEQIEKFAEYCFNRAHSAAYAFVAYQTAYLKAHYTVEYLSALLSSVASDQDKTQDYIEEALKYGIKVLPPDINKSYAEFTPDENNIRFGLASVKQVGEIVVEAIIKEREANGDFESIYDFCKRVDSKCSNKRVMEGLIKAGAFSNIEKSRKQLLENLELIVSTANRETQSRDLGQCSLFDGIEDCNAPQFNLAGSDEEFDDKQIQSFEKEFLGFYVTSHPLSSIRDKLPFLMTHKISELSEIPEGKMVTICGLITSIKQIPTKKDPTKFIKFVTVEDLSGKIEVVCFSRKLAEFDTFLQPEQKVIISGKVSRRDEASLSLILENAKLVENSNILTLELLEEITYEELVALKDILVQHTGSDPVIIKVSSEGEPVKIISSSIFWVNSSNELVNSIKKNFPKKVAVNIKSLDN
ncbi:MAG: DNA polymerase III subunit alpha [Candidatus Gastranaerophilales bacterium]|nr:DNA polymerase III subunit alpha [Candidatus Gastranaerophilales bacterium]